MTEDRLSRERLKRYIAKRPVGTIKGILYTFIGGISTFIFSISIIANVILADLNMIGKMAVLAGVMSVVFFLISTSILVRGIYLRKRVKRFKNYVKSLDGETQCSIEKLSQYTGKSHKYLVRDLKKMISLDMFLEAHFDEQETYFMLSNESYEAYLALQDRIARKKEEEIKRKRKIEQDMNDPNKKEIIDTIELGNKYIKEIRVANEAILEEVFSKKLDRLEYITSKIFENLKTTPSKIQDVNKFLNHYLPMTLKLVNSYKQLSNQSVEGENIKNAKKDISNGMDTINIAFEKLLDDLFQEVAIDVSTDVSVLETLLEQDGLKKGDFNR